MASNGKSSSRLLVPSLTDVGLALTQPIPTGFLGKEADLGIHPSTAVGIFAGIEIRTSQDFRSVCVTVTYGSEGSLLSRVSLKQTTLVVSEAGKRMKTSHPM